MQAELGLAVFTATIEIGRLVNKIKEIHDNRAQNRCKKLTTEAKLLKTLLESKSANVASEEIIHDAEDRLKDITKYIDKTADSTFFEDAKEVQWTKRYLEILSDVARVKDGFLIEMLSRTTLTPLASSKPRATFNLANPSIIRFTDTQENEGFGTSDIIGEFVCYKFESSNLSLESLRIYPRLQDRAYVQRLKGLADVKGQLYVFMQNCSQWPTINTLYNLAEIGGPKELVSRVELAMKIAQTVAWYHQSDVILKAIYDHYIAIKEEGNGHWTPILTGLDHMRTLYERMSGFRFDCRYEAPEFHAIGEHTLFTDIWSLGTVAWQIMCASFPFDIPMPVDSAGSSRGNRVPNRNSIRALLQRNENPGEFPSYIPQFLADVLGRCWDRDSLSRPSAREVAGMLQETWLRLVQNEDGTLSPLDQNMGQTNNGLIEQAKERARLLVTDKRAQGNSNNGRILGKLSIEHTEALLDGEFASRGECAFLVGASVWWKRLDERSYSLVVERAKVEYTSEDENCKRAELALAFLQKAARNGNKDCYWELWHAHTTLSRYYKQKYPALGLNSTSQT